MMTRQQASGEHAAIIRASEVGQFAFCSRAWWLTTVQQVQPANIQQLQHGQATHQQHGRRVVAYHWLRNMGYLLLAAAVTLGVITLWVFARG